MFRINSFVFSTSRIALFLVDYRQPDVIKGGRICTCHIFYRRGFPLPNISLGNLHRYRWKMVEDGEFPILFFDLEDFVHLNFVFRVMDVRLTWASLCVQRSGVTSGEDAW